MFQTPKKVYMTYSGATKLSTMFHDSMSNSSARSAGDVWEGLSNGIATGFGGDHLIPAAAFVPTLNVVASPGGDLATPVSYWFAKYPIRVRTGATNAGGVPATSGLTKISTNNSPSRGILRMGLADVNAASQIIIDQGALPFLDLRSDFEVHFDIAAIENRNILATAGFADFGVFTGAVAVDPTAVPSTNGVYIKFTAGNATLYRVVTGTATVLGVMQIPDRNFVLTLRFDSVTRRIFACIDGNGFGTDAHYIAPPSWTTMQLGGRVCHLAAFAAATDAPLAVEVDSLIVTQFSSGAAARERV